MKDKPNKITFIGTLKHRDGKKLSQLGVAFPHQTREVREHPTGGFRVRKGA